MQFGALKVFCDVARHRSFSQAAHANEITQSAVSQIVSQLERHMSVQLVDRSTRPLHLTPLGQTFYEGCQSLLDQYQELESKISKAQAEIAGVVQVAAIYSVGMSDMGQYVRRFEELQPSAEVHLEYLHPDRVYQKVEEGTADMGLVSFPSKNGKLAVIPWREETMVVVCPRNHRLAQHAAVSLSDLNGQKFVHFDRNLVIRRKIDRFFKEHGVAVEVVHEFDNIENIKQAVVIGSGIAFLPEPTIQREVKQKSLIALPTQSFKMVRPLGILLKRGHWLSAAAKTFLDLLQGANGTNGKLKNGKH